MPVAIEDIGIREGHQLDTEIIFAREFKTGVDVRLRST
jgi:hypothetical protein